MKGSAPGAGFRLDRVEQEIIIGDQAVVGEAEIAIVADDEEILVTYTWKRERIAFWRIAVQSLRV